MFERLLDIRPGEARRVYFAFITLVLVVGANTIVKAVRDAVFLSRFGVTELSLVSIGLALVMSFVVGGYLRISRGASRERLITALYAVTALVLAALGALLASGAGAGWLPWVLYVVSTLFGMFLVMQAWLMIGDVFDLREAKRLFGFIGAGAIVGGAVGGGLTRALAAPLGSGPLLVGASLLLVGGIATSRSALRARPHEEKDEKARSLRPKEVQAGGLLALARSSSLVRTFAIGALLATLAGTLLDWQVKAIAKHAFAGNEAAMIGFFGTLLAALSVVSFVLQLTCTGWFFRRFGVGAGRAAMPVVMVLGGVVLSLHGVVPWSLVAGAAGARVAEGGLRFSLDKSASELTWLPVDAETRERAKTFVETVVDRVATALAGLTWLFLAAIGWDAPERLHLVGSVVAGYSLIHLALLPSAHRAYLDALRGSLTRREVDIDNLAMGLGHADMRRTVEEALASGEAGRVRFALYLLSSGEGADLPDLTPALEHADPAIRLEAVELLGKRPLSARAPLAARVRDGDDAVSELAVRILRTTSPGPNDPVLATLSEHRDPHTQFASAIIALGTSAPAPDDTRSLSEIFEHAEPASRPALVALLGAAPPEVVQFFLEPLLESDDEPLVLIALATAARAGASSLVPTMAKLLTRPRLRAKVVEAVAMLDAHALDHLVDLLPRTDLPLAARRAIVRLAGSSGEQKLAERLTPWLETDEPELAHAALRALVRLRSSTSYGLDLSASSPLLMREVTALHRELSFLGRGAWPTARRIRDDDGLLERSLCESTDARVERIFGWLRLAYPVRDIQFAHRGLQSPQRRAQASSLELLDNVLGGDLRAALLPALEDADAERYGAQSRRVLARAREPAMMNVASLLDGRERWLAAAAAWVAGAKGEVALLDALRGAADVHPAEDVRAVCRRSIDHLVRGLPMEVNAELTVVEKVLRLRSVDVLGRVSSENLAYVAQIASELEVAEGAAIYTAGDHPDALYIVLQGRVRLHSDGDDLGEIEAGEAFGSWALLDDAPRTATATATTKTRLLRVDREEFTELLADRVEIVQALFKAMVERIRGLAELTRA